MRTIRPEDNQLTPEQIAHRHVAFNIWLGKAGQKIGFHNLPSTVVQEVHQMLRKAFNAGSNYEARMALEEQDEC